MRGASGVSALSDSIRICIKNSGKSSSGSAKSGFWGSQLLPRVCGAVVTAMSWVTNHAHSILFQIPLNERLSGQVSLASPWLALVPVVGGVLMAVLAALSRRLFTRPPVDPIEANALHGGRMSVRESLMVSIQTMVSSSYGASVGLEAGYTQASSGLVSHVSGRLGLRRRKSAPWSAAPLPALSPPPLARR